MIVGHFFRLTKEEQTTKKGAAFKEASSVPDSEAFAVMVAVLLSKEAPGYQPLFFGDGISVF